jgi:hypothetical protein
MDFGCNLQNPKFPFYPIDPDIYELLIASKYKLVGKVEL